MHRKPQQEPSHSTTVNWIRNGAIALVGAATLLVGGCGQPQVSPPTASQAASPDFSQAELASWIRFRVIYGLRSDLEWVLKVAEDPTAVGAEYRVPLLQDELERVAEANSSADLLGLAARRYADVFPTFAGSWMELPRVVLAFTDELPARRAEVEALFGASVVVREVRYTLDQLQGFEKAMLADAAWFVTNNIKVIDISVDEMGNAVEIRYRAPTQEVEPLVREQYADSGWLRFEWAGPLPWEGPFGDLELTVVDSNGQPVDVVIVLRPNDPRVNAFGPAELEDGKFADKGLAAVDWLVEIKYSFKGEEKTVTREFTVRPDELVKVKVVLDQ